jgi:hypothetical protein
VRDDAAVPEPGWYEDPDDAGRVRWWDGAAWTARTAVAPGAGPDHLDDRDHPSRWPTVLVVGAVAVVAGLGAFLGVLAVLDDEDEVGSGDGGPEGTAETTASTVPTVELVVGPTEPAIVAVLGSIAQAEVDAEAAAERARALAAVDARVLDSNRFTTEGRPVPLTAGLWVLWSGPFADEAAAQAFCDGEVAAAGVAECYPLRVVPAP